MKSNDAHQLNIFIAIRHYTCTFNSQQQYFQLVVLKVLWC